MEKPDVVILCGGRGSRLSEETVLKPKPMVEIGDKPILWHIMKIYSHYGYNRFILALGYQGEYIKRYFNEYRMLASDFTLVMHPDKPPVIHNLHEHSDWEITFVDTGIDTLKGGRIKRLEKYIKSDNFHLTYGDTVSSVDVEKLHDFHISHSCIGTVTAVRPPSRFGALTLAGEKVIKFEEKPQVEAGLINGGFFVFKRKFLEYLTPEVNCDFEIGTLQKLAQDAELRAYRHAGFSLGMDNVRDRDYLNKLWDTGRAEWKVWK